jgi:hypothetical protein
MLLRFANVLATCGLGHTLRSKQILGGWHGTHRCFGGHLRCISSSACVATPSVFTSRLGSLCSRHNSRPSQRDIADTAESK